MNTDWNIEHVVMRDASQVVNPNLIDDEEDANEGIANWRDIYSKEAKEVVNPNLDDTEDEEDANEVDIYTKEDINDDDCDCNITFQQIILDWGDYAFIKHKPEAFKNRLYRSYKLFELKEVATKKMGFHSKSPKQKKYYVDYIAEWVLRNYPLQDKI
jgi:hypothetical protein